MTVSRTSSRAKFLKQLGLRLVESRDGIEEYEIIRNGFRIVLKPNRFTTVCAFSVLYFAGSRNEGAGNTGSAHFFEHLMFKGTRQFDPKEGNDAFSLFDRTGAELNANTSWDRTVYFECLAPEYLPLAIKFEADRMRGLKNRKGDRDSEMTVVRNEMEQREDSVSTVLGDAVSAAAFTAHPYRHSVIGHRSDVENIPLARMVEFYDRFYRPNNAVAVCVGNFETQAVLVQLSKHFGRIPRSPSPIPSVYTVEPPQEGERRVEIRRPGANAEVLIAYHVPAANHPDIHALDVLSRLLGNSDQPEGRLYQVLIDTGLAFNCYAGNSSRRDPGLFFLNADFVTDVDASKVEQALYAELTRLAAEPVSEAVLARLKEANRNGTLINCDDPLEEMNLLTSSEALGTTWRFSAEYDEKFDLVTPADIMRVAQTYFKASNRTVGNFIPDDTAQRPRAAPVEAKPVVERSYKKKRVKLVAPKESRPLAPDVVRHVLPNGLTLSILSTPGTGSVAVGTTMYAGTYFAAANKPGVVQLTASLLTCGSARFSKSELAEIIGQMGINFSFATWLYNAGCNTLMAAKNLPQFAEVLADTLAHPSFSEQEFALAVGKRRSRLQSFAKDTSTLAAQALYQSIYPVGHALRGATLAQGLNALETMQVADVRAFHSAHVSPKSTLISVVGDVEPEAAIELFARHFGAWTGPERRAIAVAPVTEFAVGKVVEFLPDQSNVSIAIGRATDITRSAPRQFFAASIANNVLGGNPVSSRLGKVVRDKNGLTYGITSYFGDSRFGAASWSIDLAVNPVNVDKALALVRQVVDEYRAEGISDYELEDAISQFAGQLPNQMRSSAGKADNLNTVEFSGLGVGELDNVVSTVRSITKDEVNAAIREYFNLDQCVTVMAGTLSN